MTPSEEIAAMLERRGWTPYRLAKRAGVPPSTVTRLLLGQVQPMHATMVKLRAASKTRP